MKVCKSKSMSSSFKLQEELYVKLRRSSTIELKEELQNVQSVHDSTCTQSTKAWLNLHSDDEDNTGLLGCTRDPKHFSFAHAQ